MSNSKTHSVGLALAAAQKRRQLLQRKLVVSVRRSLRLTRRTAASTYRLLTVYVSYLRRDKRAAIVHVATAASIFLAFGFLAVLLHYGLPDKLSDIGSYLAGVGQAIVLIWIIATFSLQRAELGDQRTELEMQRVALQQQTIVVIYDHHRAQLDKLAQQLVKLSISSEAYAKEQEASQQQTDSFFARLIVENRSVQDGILQKVDEQDIAVAMCIEGIITRYRAIREAIAQTDPSGLLRQTLLAETPFSDVYHLLSGIYGDMQPVDENDES
jgi:hypothetical protein